MMRFFHLVSAGFTSLDVGEVTVAGFDAQFLCTDLTASGSVAGGGPLKLRLAPLLDVPPRTFGDFNLEQQHDWKDIDALTRAVRQGIVFHYDLNGDDVLNQEDHRIWVERIKRTYFGDADLDGEFNSRDFVKVFTLGQYGDAIVENSTWATGDWDGNLDFDSGDFVTAFTSGGYEVGPRSSMADVPEPAALILAGFARLAAECTS